MGFAKFMSNGVGRGLRIFAGLALIVIGLFSAGGTGGLILAIIGAVPLLAGIFDACLFAPLSDGPLKGAKAHASAQSGRFKSDRSTDSYARDFGGVGAAVA